MEEPRPEKAAFLLKMFLISDDHLKVAVLRLDSTLWLEQASPWVGSISVNLNVVERRQGFSEDRHGLPCASPSPFSGWDSLHIGHGRTWSQLGSVTAQPATHMK